MEVFVLTWWHICAVVILAGGVYGLIFFVSGPGYTRSEVIGAGSWILANVPHWYARFIWNPLMGMLYAFLACSFLSLVAALAIKVVSAWL